MNDEALVKQVKKKKQTGQPVQSSLAAGPLFDGEEEMLSFSASAASTSNRGHLIRRQPQAETEAGDPGSRQEDVVRTTRIRKSSAAGHTASGRVIPAGQLFGEEPASDAQHQPVKKKPRPKLDTAAPIHPALAVAPDMSAEAVAKALYPYFIEGRKLKKWVDEKGNKIAKVVSDRVEIKKVIIDEDTGEVFDLLSFDFAGQEREKIVSRGMLTRNRAPELLKYGVDVADSKMVDVLIFLNKQEKIVPHVRAHTSVGVGEVDGKLVFRLARGIGVESEYVGGSNLKPTGKYEVWHQLIEDEVVGHPPLELALVFGLAALVVSLLRAVTGQDTLLVHLYGDSTQGKTTAAMVAVASFGEPHTSNGGLVLSWNTTDNAIRGALRNNHGVPLAIDEASVQTGKDFTAMIYGLSAGRDKGRANVDGSLQQSAEWSTVLVSTAEHSLSSHANRNTGLQMRMLEFGNVSWTKSADNADRLKEGLRQNYGHAGEVFAEHLLAVGRDQVEALWREWRDSIVAELPEEDRFKVRVADKLALLMATAELAAEALALDLDLEGIKQMLLRADQLNPVDRDLADKAYDFLLEHFTTNKASFSSSPGQSIWEKPQCLGRFVATAGQISEVYFLTEHLRRALKEGGFPDSQVALKALRDKGLLDAEDGKLTRKKKVLGETHNVHVLRLKQELPDDSSENKSEG